MPTTPKLVKNVSVGKIATTVNSKFDATTLHDKPKLAAESQLVDDGTGERTTWRVEKFDLVPVPDKLQGVFFSGDCYVMKYTYLAGGTEKHLIYYWLVSHMSSVWLYATYVLKQTSIKSMANFVIPKDYL
jgi:villin 1/advillin